jgi:hypothetical protein
MTLIAAGCAHGARPGDTLGALRGDTRGAISPDSVPRETPRCWTCDTVPMEHEMVQAVEARIADLKTRGGDCLAYGSVLETSFRNGRITLRPAMWRHGSRLVAGEARLSGEMMLAREIDSLNVGRRGIQDVVWSMEHEAVHIAFGIPSASQMSENAVNAHVHTCRS